MLGSIPHKNFCFYHLPTRGRAGIKLGAAWYVSNVSIIFDCSMLLYYLFWMFNGLYYARVYYFWDWPINRRPSAICCFFAYFNVSQKRNIKRNPNGMKPSRGSFLEQTQSRRLGVDVKKEARRPRGRRARPPPSWAPRSSTDQLLSPIYILLYPETFRDSNKTTFPPPQPSVTVRSHLGAFSGTSPEGESITKGFYINTIASPMMCE